MTIERKSRYKETFEDMLAQIQEIYDNQVVAMSRKITMKHDCFLSYSWKNSRQQAIKSKR